MEKVLVKITLDKRGEPASVLAIIRQKIKPAKSESRKTKGKTCNV